MRYLLLLVLISCSKPQQIHIPKLRVGDCATVDGGSKYRVLRVTSTWYTIKFFNVVEPTTFYISDLDLISKKVDCKKL